MTSTTKIVNGYTIPASCDTEKLLLSKKNAHERDAHIFFDEEPHTYYISGKSDYVSCTTFIHQFFEDFNADKIVHDMTSNMDTFTSGGKHYEKYGSLYVDGMTRDELKRKILQSWDVNRIQAATLGTNLHRNIELFYNKEPVFDNSKEFKYFLSFNIIESASDMVPYRTEWLIYDESCKICGSIDMIYYNPKTKEYHMVDWKRSKEIKTDSFRGKMGLEPLVNVPDCNYFHYALQLNLYRYILEENYNIIISSMRIVVLHPNNSNFIEYDIPAMNEEIYKIVEHQKDKNVKKKQKKIDLTSG